MNIEIRPIEKLAKTPLLVCLVSQGERPEYPAGVSVPSSVEADFDGSAKKQVLAYGCSGKAERVLLLGLGKAGGLDSEALRRAGALAVKRAGELELASLNLVCSAHLAERVGGAERAGMALAEGVLLGAYRFDACKSESKPSKLKQVVLHGPGDSFRKGVEHGRRTAGANAYARDLQNAPGNHLTPSLLAAAAKKLVRKGGRLSCQIFDESALKRMGMGLLLSVAQGSKEPPRLIHLNYKPKQKKRGTIALVGKGLTFDAGGYSLKPALKMEDMRFDMSGGAAVLGVFHLLAQIDLPLEVHGVVPSSENLIDGGATKPGDVHTAMNGKTVEVLNTDAEGRLILADALTFCEKKLSPDTIIDLATLTGAVTTALGHELSGLFASQKQLQEDLIAAGESVGERLWPLPLLEVHKASLKGVNADLKNIAGSEVGAGSSIGAAFLAHFVREETAWAHLDIAGTAYGGSNREWVGGPRGSGVGTRLLIQYLLSRAAGR